MPNPTCAPDIQETAWIQSIVSLEDMAFQVHDL